MNDWGRLNPYRVVQINGNGFLYRIRWRNHTDFGVNGPGDDNVSGFKRLNFTAFCGSRFGQFFSDWLRLYRNYQHHPFTFAAARRIVSQGWQGLAEQLLGNGLDRDGGSRVGYCVGGYRLDQGGSGSTARGLFHAGTRWFADRGWENDRRFLPDNLPRQVWCCR